jgi:hypothetical protein
MGQRGLLGLSAHLSLPGLHAYMGKLMQEAAPWTQD